MGRPGIMYVHVADAAARLAAQGKNPTIDSIREALGGTGSKSTIAPLLKRWKAAHQDSIGQAELGLPAELVLALKGVYEKVQADAALRYQQATQAHQAETAAFQEKFQQVFAEQEALRTIHDEQAQALTEANAHVQVLDEVRHRQEVALASLGSEKIGLEQRLTDRASEVTSLTQQLMQVRAQFEHYQESVAQQRTDELQAAEQRHNRLEQEFAEIRQRLLAQQARLGELQGQEQCLAQDNDRLQNTLLTTQDALTKSRNAHEQVVYQFTELKQIHQALEQHHGTGEQRLAETRTNLAVVERERTLLAERLTWAETQLTGLAADKQLLLEEKAVLSSQLAEFSARA